MRLPSYPIISHSDISFLGLQQTEFSFTSTAPGIIPIADHNSWGTVNLGVEGAWNPSKHDLTISTGLLLSNPNFLFGKYVCSRAGVCLAIEWKGRESAQRGISNIIPIWQTDRETEGDFTLRFKPAQIKGSLTLDLNLYIMQAASDFAVLENEFALANTEGICLGKLCDSCEINWEANREPFPITECDGKRNDPLWKMVFSSNDPATDHFTSNFLALELNRNHSDFPAFKGETGSSVKHLSPLAREVIASWMGMVFLILKEKHPSLYSTLESGEFEHSTILPDSIAYTAGYWLRTFNIHLGTHTDLFSSIRKVVSEQLRSDRGSHV